MSVKVRYHVFTDNIDWYYYSLMKAESKFEELKKDNRNVRLYEESFDDDGDMMDEDCLDVYGDFPT